jgi:hypothetical protein
MSGDRSRQHAAVMALAARRGEISPASLRDPAREMHDSLSEAELTAIARARPAGPPDRRGED